MDQNKIWNFYQTKAKEVFNKSTFRLQYLTKYISIRDDVLNVGVGGGIFEKYAVLKGVRIWSIDPDWQSLKLSSENSSFHPVVGFLEKLPFLDNSFNKVVVSEVLEHLSPIATEQALNEIFRVLKKKGKVIGTVPFQENLADNTVICPKCGEVFHKFGHLQSFTTKKITSLLFKYFSTVKCYQRPFMAKEKIGYKEKIVDFLRKPLVQIGILTRDKHIVFLAEKH